MGWKEHLRKLRYGYSMPMSEKLDEWWGWYTAENGWYTSIETSAATRRTYKVERLTIKPARMVCQEYASLLLNERTLVAADDEAVNAYLEAWVGSSRFFASGQRLLERTFALGTGAWALRVEGVLENQAFSPKARIVPQRFDARQVIPLSYDEDSCTECAFLSKVIRKGKMYDQLQTHRLEEGRYVIETVFFDSSGKKAELEGIATEFKTTDATPLFAIVRPGLENTYWDYSPFGVSVFDDAIGAIKLVDTGVDNMYRDIHLGQKMLFLDESMIEQDAEGNTIVPRERDQQLFRRTEVGSSSQNMVEEYNPDLRVTDNRMALSTGLELLGSRCGMGSDYFSLENQDGVVKTATEVVAEQSDLFRNVRKHENALSPAIVQLINGVLYLARTVQGVTLPEESAIKVQFDDSVIEDTAARRKQDLEDIAAGLMQPYEYRVKWYGEDEPTARKMTDSEGLPPEE